MRVLELLTALQIDGPKRYVRVTIDKQDHQIKRIKTDEGRVIIEVGGTRPFPYAEFVKTLNANKQSKLYLSYKGELSVVFGYRLVDDDIML